MSRNKLRSAFILVFIGANLAARANGVVDKYVERVAQEAKRIDLIDGAEDGYISLKSGLQSAQATSTYLTTTQSIVDKILADGLSSDIQKTEQLRRVLDLMQDVTPKNVHFYTQFKPIFDLIAKVQDVEDVNRLNAILKSNVYAGL
ncbi:MAG: hypothetical protein QMC68_08980, partial [Bacteroidia bacterium]